MLAKVERRVQNARVPRDTRGFSPYMLLILLGVAIVGFAVDMVYLATSSR